MDLGSIFLILALFILTALYISRPLYERRSIAVSHVDHELSALMAERDRILDALSDLDFDNTLGKVPAEDYPERRAQLVQRGAEVLRQLDALQDDVASDAASTRLEDALQPDETHPDDELEAQIAARRRKRQEKSSGFCPQCGGSVVQSDRFCPKCGTRLD